MEPLKNNTKGNQMFRPWPKIPRLENEVYHITEKIDGTNACIIIQPYLYEKEQDCIWTDLEHSVYAQSRTKLIKPSNDNYGFAKWVQANAEQLVTDLGVGYHFGEWWGQGIQRNYGLTEKRFSLFNPTKRSSICSNVPLLKSLTQDEFENTTWKEQYKAEFEEFGSVAAPGFMKPEGLVVYAEKAKTYWKVIFDK